MALADNVAVPSPPLTYPVYRGFYILPGDTLPTSVVRIDFFVGRSKDDLTWENWTLLGSGTNATGFFQVHTGLDENICYAYYCQYIYSDGSKSPIGQQAYPGAAQLIVTPTLNIDQLASKAYTTGLVTAGTFRGVVFETNATNPKVRMDPTGIFATSAAGATVFDLPSDGSTAFFRGELDALSLTLPWNVNGSDALRWTADGTSTGQLLAYLTAAQTGPGTSGIVELVSGSNDPLDNGEAALFCARASGDAVNTYVWATANDAAGTTTFGQNQVQIIGGDGASHFLKLSGGLHSFHIDNNNAAFYVLNFSIASLSTQTLSFNTTNTSSWSAAIPVGAVTSATFPNYGGWTYTFTGSNTFNISLGNASNGTLNATWVGVVIGK